MVSHFLVEPFDAVGDETAELDISGIREYRVVDRVLSYFLTRKSTEAPFGDACYFNSILIIFWETAARGYALHCLIFSMETLDHLDIAMMAAPACLTSEKFQNPREHRLSFFQPVPQSVDALFGGFALFWR